MGTIEPQLPALPESTYRLQFHAGFTFRDAAAIVPYLHDLGVTHCYASPYLKARPGSTHGYDVIDHCRLNPELGTEADYEAWLAAMRERGMSHILDTVPNHVGVATNDNPWWNDVLAHGPASPYGAFFDIAWRGSPRPELHDKVLLPVLGGRYGEVLERGELRLVHEDGRFAVAYYDRRFPVDPDTVPPDLTEDGGATALDAFNGTPGDPRSFDRLDALLNAQHHRLAYWHTASDEINYRRFFDINDLAALAMERPEVFEAVHAFTLRLVAEGKVAGLRIDHPDGLYDPKQYFRRLRDAAAKEAKVQSLYVVAEKILAPGEPLPGDWAVHGTSGYDFLNMVNGLFIDPANEEAFTRLYHDWTGDTTTFADLVYAKKKLILKISLASELQMLAHRLDRLAQKDRRSRDFTLSGLRRALRETIACFPVYRSYTSDEGTRDEDRAYVETAIAEAIRRNPKTDPSIFRFLRDVLMLKYPDTFTDEDRAGQRQFAGKFQQLTAPATAKGVEDTAFYIYNRFVSLNEVGGEPGHFGVPPADLHAYLQDRQAKWPYALSALSTHDTKRSEDVRARLNVLSEMPDEWRAAVERWRRLNEPHRREVGDGLVAPDANAEYLLYQTLVGAWPLDPYGAEDLSAFVRRVQAYMEKAQREAKVYTSWTDPNAGYEAAVTEFIARILDERAAGDFLADFRPFQRRVSEFGLLNSLSQTLLRIAAPGVPDTYQGSELWDFSLVDPDNRRPVDYRRRREMLAELNARVESAGADRAELAAELLRTNQDGRVKLYVTWQALRCRRENAGLFSAGAYLPADVDSSAGQDHKRVVGFARRHAGRAAIVAVPRFVAGDPVAWHATDLIICGLDPGTRFTHVMTGRPIELWRRENGAAAVNAADLFADFPVALLMSVP